MSTAPALAARLVEIAPGVLAAFGPHATLELLEAPQPVPVPGGASYGHGLLEWQGSRISMLDLEALLFRDTSRERKPVPRYALVVAYQRTPGAPLEHGAIGIAQPPQLVMLVEPVACDWPEGDGLWQQLSLSCFKHAGQPVPILDTAKLFGRFHG